MSKSSVSRSLVAAGAVVLFGAYLVSNLSNSRPGRAAAAIAPTAPTAPTAEVAEVAEAGREALPGKIIFNRDVRPILSDRCFPCHGFDPNKRQSGLRLDTREGAFDPLPKHKDKRAFVPGKPEASFAYQRMISKDPKEVMPPATSHLKLNDEDKQVIRRWIEQGAKWQDHWAFIKPVRPELPAVKDAKWCRNDIDRFILARLEEQGLHPSPEADKATLIRRVSLDLTGLPPTPAEVEAFENDTSPNAYEKVVDRLLASPHYGEQMAVQWLDEARYADSHGFQSDPERFMWHWRDWVINAYNTNMPFDEFTIEQLAGDLLPHPTESQLVATGFNRNHRINSEGGVIDEEWRVETVIDRVDTTGSTFLGLTLGCCRCHDHKFDPISQKEFYSFYSFFNNVDERGEAFPLGIDAGKNAPPLIKVFAPEQKAQLDKDKAVIADAEAKVAALEKRLPEYEQKYREEGIKAPEPGGLALRFALDGTPDAAGVVAGSRSTASTRPVAKVQGKPAVWIDGKIAKAIKFDGSGATWIDAGDAVNYTPASKFSVAAWVNLQGGEGSILNRMDPGPSFRGFDLYLQQGKLAPHIVNNWPSNAVKVVTAEPLPMNKWVHVMVTYDGSRKASGVKVYLDGVALRTTVEEDNLHGKSLRPKSPLLIGKRVEMSPLNGSVDDVRFYNRALAPEEVARLGAGPDLDRILAMDPAKRTAADQSKLAAVLLALVPEYNQAVNARDRARSDSDAIENDPSNTTMVMQEMPKPRQAYVLVRGQYDKHGEKVYPGVPSVLNPFPAGAPHNRLGLAEWIASPENPLTARVQVNRFWEKFFGVGIVKSSENFGTQADWPSHPELLDWLATEFMGLHWDMKAIQREIVTSATYRQSSNVTPELLEKDPDNRLLARGPRFRLSAEQIRDQALAVSGLLSDKIGGPSVKPYEPGNLWDGNLYGNLKKYVEDKGDSLYRRTVYTFLKRTAAPANLMVFDMPSREYCVVRRSRSNTPLQALDVLNDPTYVEAARMLAEEMMKDGGATPGDRLAYGFRRTECRAPTAAETKILDDQFATHLAHYRQSPEDASKLLAVGETPRDPRLDPPELAAYTMTASIILNLDETLNKP